jgi:hypothetical protein
MKRRMDLDRGRLLCRRIGDGGAGDRALAHLTSFLRDCS